MAAQAPFDPGGGGLHADLTINDGNPDLQPTDPIDEHAAEVGGAFQSSAPSEDQNAWFPPQHDQMAGYDQYTYVAWPQGQNGLPASRPSYTLETDSLQTASSSRLALKLPTFMPNRARVHGFFNVQHAPAPTARRNSMPPGYHPYSYPPNSPRNHNLQDQPLMPLCREFAEPGATSYRQITETQVPASQIKRKAPPKAIASNGCFVAAVQPRSVGCAAETSQQPLPKSLHQPSLSTSTPAAQVVSTAPQRPTLRLGGGRRTPSATVRGRTNSNELGGPAQGRLVLDLAKPKSVIILSVRDVFNDEQCDKILWLVLHGIPSGAVANLLTIGSDAIRAPSSRTKRALLAGLNVVVQHFVPELAMGRSEGEEPDVLIQRLLDRAVTLYWSPFFLKRAIDYTFIADDDVGGKKERKKNARERSAAFQWDSHHEEGPAEPPARRNNKKAFGGMMRQASEQDIIEEFFGYRQNNHDVERVLMKKWLLKIREVGKLPAQLNEGEVPSAGSASAATTTV